MSPKKNSLSSVFETVLPETVFGPLPRYGFHLYRGGFAEVLGSGVVGTLTQNHNMATVATDSNDNHNEKHDQNNQMSAFVQFVHSILRDALQNILPEGQKISLSSVFETVLSHFRLRKC